MTNQSITEKQIAKEIRSATLKGHCYLIRGAYVNSLSIARIARSGRRIKTHTHSPVGSQAQSESFKAIRVVDIRACRLDSSLAFLRVRHRSTNSLCAHGLAHLQ